MISDMIYWFVIFPGFFKFFSPAIYLACTLALATIAVLFVIIVVNVHHTSEDKEMSPAIESFGFRLEGCLCRRKKTSGTNQTKIAPSPEESIVKQPCGGNDVTDHEDSRQEMTWKKLSGLLDRFFFLTFMFTIALATGAFIMIISLKLLSY